jgi:hypothetical protein
VLGGREAARQHARGRAGSHEAAFPLIHHLPL